MAADGGYGTRSQFETEVRMRFPTANENTSWSFTPLDKMLGQSHRRPACISNAIMAASRRSIPAKHMLYVHGMVDGPRKFTMADLKRFPSVTRKYFIECSGNGLTEWNKPTLKTVQGTHGLLSTSEWTGVQFATIAREVGLKDGGAWVLAEGADAAVMTRSIPMEKMLKDAILAYGQNGEAIRPEQGYPLRLLLPGYEGNTHIKWLRRLEVSDKPFMTREETSKYTDLLANGKARQFSFDMEAKSVITFPSGEMKLPGAGFYNIGGLAWSGRGRVQSVDVSTDGGTTWVPARIESVPEPICTVRFSLPWMWNGQAGRPAKPMHRRNRLHPADTQAADRNPRLERTVRLDLSPQCHPELGHCSRRERHQCPRIILIHRGGAHRRARIHAHCIGAGRTLSASARRNAGGTLQILLDSAGRPRPSAGQRQRHQGRPDLRWRLCRLSWR